MSTYIARMFWQKNEGAKALTPSWIDRPQMDGGSLVPIVFVLAYVDRHPHDRAEKVVVVA